MLNEKDRPILRTIIDVYVGEAVPVSSQRVRDAGRFRMSTATIRNRMVALEREGFIAKAHVSSGRIQPIRPPPTWTNCRRTRPQARHRGGSRRPSRRPRLNA
jgi:hypothetical protein